MSFPFDTIFYDTLYAGVADILKVEYPQQESESIQEWYKRLLYEFMSYLQSQYEPSTADEKVNPGEKTNKKKDTPTKTYSLSEPTLFSGNVENALEVVSQDSDFAIYLFGWWLPLLITPTDWFCLCITIDCDNTPAQDIKLKSVQIKVDNMLSRVTIVSLNGGTLSSMSKSKYNKLNNDPYTHKVFKAINYLMYSNANTDFESIRSAGVVNMNIADYQNNSFRFAEFLYKIKNLTKSLFISEISIKSNLIPENNNELKLNKGQTEKTQRKKFNARKLLKAEDVSASEMASGILQTLSVQTFRTFYDYDALTIDQELFDYMFYDKPLVL